MQKGSITMKIGYLGPMGTFSEQAARAYSKAVVEAELIQYSSIYQVMEAVEQGDTQECVVPLENSIEGTVTSTIDFLIFHPQLYIKAEIVIPIWEDFLVHANYNGEPITQILSHPQALAQCTEFIRHKFPHCTLRPTNSTAEAAEIVAKSTEPIAALAPQRAAEVYGLHSLYHAVQDDDNNSTRFVVVTKERVKERAAKSKSSIVFATQNKPGDLHRILDILSIWEINMTKIESRPMKHQLGTYVFFIDLEATNLPDLKAALKLIARKTSFFKFLGSYPVLKWEVEKNGKQ